MFYSHTILARKSPLGTVWIAAHLERKIKKPQIDGIDIPSYAECIMFPEVPIALRLSGHLLLGLVRIYSWKVNYLFQDCNRMLSTIRTAFASVQVDLPVDADRAPFESITLPDTFNLDDLILDDALHQIDTPDNHQKSLDQITLSGDYVMIDLDEDVRVEPLAPEQSPHMGPEPTEEERLPPFHIDFEANGNQNVEISVNPSQENTPAVNPSNINQADTILDSPEIMREAPFDGPELNLPDFDGVNNEPMDMTQEHSPFVSNKMTPPTMEQIITPDQGLPGTSIHNLRGTTSTTYDHIDDVMPIHSGIPDLRIEPSPPQVQDNKRKGAPKVRDNKRTKRMKYDKEIVFSNAYMKRQIGGDELYHLIGKRRKLPQTAVDVWKISRTRQKDSFFLEPSVYGMCSKLHQTYERNFPRFSDTHDEFISDDHTPGVANVSIRDTSPDHRLSPKSPGNADAQPEHQLNPQSPTNADGQPLPEHHPKSPVNADAQLSVRNADGQPEPELSPKSPGDAYTVHNVDMPEIPRFSPQDIPSSIRDDNSPFKTPGASRTPKSGHGGTAATRILSADMSYISPGQDSYPQLSPFPFNDDLNEDLPEIPSLMSTPGVISTAGTGATGLGSMSTRTRAVARYFKEQMASAMSDGQPGQFSLNRILEGRDRKQAARMFMETLVLKSYDYIDVQQQESYGDIAVSIKRSLSEAKL
ncbi:hypothetical protein GUJ93_ZPchr0010g9022 [Zizania palustris]|uniref:Sister chromatid cohesion 1 protein 3 n=1 Tax=Zizania palustris TaxID=103762 RepID=A0A8J5WEX5_ZIZPA|nr:hypothetical protein GUJ93_ZPchr0010g9022 [Zizania palustris]